MKQITLNDLNVSLAFKEVVYVDHEDKYEYTDDGKRTDKVVGSRVDLFGVTEDGQKKVFTVATTEILKPDAIRLGAKVSVVEPQVSAWFDRSTHALRVAVRAKTVKVV